MKSKLRRAYITCNGCREGRLVSAQVMQFLRMNDLAISEKLTKADLVNSTRADYVNPTKLIRLES